MRVPESVRAAVIERDGQRCARCGRADGESWSVHHRRSRGAGGDKHGVGNALSNLVLLCGSGTTGCHGAVESDRAQAYEDGWLVRHGVLSPAEVPVPWRGRWSLLLDDGSVRAA